MKRFDGPYAYGMAAAPGVPVGSSEPAARPSGVPAFEPPASTCLVDLINLDDTQCLKLGVRTDWSLFPGNLRSALDGEQLQEKADMLKIYMLREMMLVNWRDAKAGGPTFMPRMTALLLYCADDEKARQLIELVASTDTPSGRHHRQTLPQGLVIEPYPTTTTTEALALSKHHASLNFKETYTDEQGNLALKYGLGVTRSPSVGEASGKPLARAGR